MYSYYLAYSLIAVITSLAIVAVSLLVIARQGTINSEVLVAIVTGMIGIILTLFFALFMVRPRRNVPILMKAWK